MWWSGTIDSMIQHIDWQAARILQLIQAGEGLTAAMPSEEDWHKARAQWDKAKDAVLIPSNVSVQVRRFVRRNLQRLVGAVHLVFWLFHLIPKGKGLADLSPCRLPPDSSD